MDPFADIAFGKWTAPVYFRVSALTASDLRAVLLAGGAVPIAFPSREVGGKRYSDAGLADELPARCLHRYGHRRIASVFLADDTVPHRFDFPGCTLCQVRRSRKIDGGLFSALDFSSAAIEGLLALGHEDADAGYREAAEWMRLQRELRTQGAANEELADALPDRLRARLRS